MILMRVSKSAPKTSYNIMRTVNTQSFLDTMIPAVYIEGIKLRDSATTQPNNGKEAATRRKTEFGKIKYTKDGINTSLVGQNITGTGLAVDIDMSLMLNTPTVRYLRSSQRTEIYVILTEDSVVINRLKGGEFKFRQLNKLATEQRIILEVIPFESFLNSSRNTASSVYNKLSFETSINTYSLNPKNLACFTFMRTASQETSSSRSFSSRNQLFGRLSGELILSNHQLQTNSYFFVSDRTDQLWAGGTHQSITGATNRLIYMEGLKHTPTPHGTLATKRSSISKIIDTRIIDSDRLIGMLQNRFLLDPRAKSLAVKTKTPEDIVLNIKNTGVSEIFPSISADQKLRSTFFINRLTVLRQNSPYSALLNNLDTTTLNEILDSTYLQNLKIGRVLDSSVLESETKIIDVSFSPQSNTFQVSEGYTRFKTEEKKELATIRYDQGYSLPKKIMPMVLTDNVGTDSTGTDFYYRMQISFRDGIRKVANKKVAKFINSCYNLQYVYKILQNGKLTDRNGSFIVDRIDKLELTKYNSASSIDAEIALFLAGLVDILDIFFKVSPATLGQISQAFYAQLNTSTGNIQHYANLISFVDELKNLLASSLNSTTLFQDSYNDAKEPSSHKAPRDVLKFSLETKSVNVNLSKSTGVEYFDTTTNQGSMPSIAATAFDRRSTQEVGKYLTDSDLGSEGTIIGKIVTNRYSDFTPLRINMDDKDFDLLVNPNAMTNRLSSLLCSVNNRTFGNSRRDHSFGFSDLKKGKRKTLIHKNEILTSLSERGISFKQTARTDNATITAGKVFGNDETNFDKATGDLADSPELFDIQSNLNFARRMANITFQDILLQSLSQQSFEELLDLADFDINYDGSRMFSLYDASKDKKNFVERLPFQIKVLSERASPSLSSKLSALFGLSQTITGNKIFPYMLFNHLLIGRITYASGFQSGNSSEDEEASTPTFSPLTPAIMNSLVGGGKILCKISIYTNGDLLAGEFKNLNLRTLNQYFTVEGGNIEQGSPEAPLLVSGPPVGRLHGFGDTARATYQNILKIAAPGHYEQMLASSLYVTQPKEVLELQYNYGSGIDLSNKKKTIVSPTQTSTPVKRPPTSRKGGYK